MLTTPELDDSGLAELLAEIARRQTSRLTLVVDAYRARALARQDLESAWTEVARGDFAESAIESVRDLAKRRRVRLLPVEDVFAAFPNAASLDDIHAQHASLDDLRKWMKGKVAVTAPTGRQGTLSEKTRRAVERAAQWRCQFDGCGEDLREHLASGVDGNFAYFAHIIAASADGPRGHKTLSAAYVDDPTNILLLCDRCHRLVDRIAPDLYPVEVLQGMRTRHVEKVNELLDNLRHPLSQPVAIGGNIAGQYAQFDSASAAAAMRARRLRASGPPQFFMRNASHLGNNATPHYWATLFEQLQSDIPVLRRMFNGDQAGGLTPESISIFPLQNMSILMLAGRLIGEARTVNIFQFDRDAAVDRPGRNWGWPAAEPPSADKYKVHIHTARDKGAEEALLLVQLTAAIPMHELPEAFQLDGRFLLPTIEVKVDEPSTRVVGHPDDLRLAGVAFGEALRVVFDEWRVKRVHVITVAPASACFRLGQKLQARSQAQVRFYERTPTSPSCGSGTRPFVPTIDVLSDAVKLPDGSATVSLL